MSDYKPQPINMEVGLEQEDGTKQSIGPIEITPQNYEATWASISKAVAALGTTMNEVVKNVAQAFRSLERVIRPFMGKAYQAGYRIENHRGRNKLVPFKKKGKK